MGTSRGALAVPAAMVAVIVLAMGVGRPASGAPARLAVAASFYPLYEFAVQVGGDRVAVRNLVPAGVEPHDHELTPRDVAGINASRVLIYNGAGFEPWVQRLVPQLPARVVRVNASEGIALRIAGGAPDPHVWLDPILAQRQVDNIAAGLSRADPDGRPRYEAGAAAYREKLQALHERIRRALAPCSKRVFVASHDAFAYFAARYGLRAVTISGLEPEAEPTPAKLREILRIVRQHDIRVIYYETLVSPRVAATIAREVGARTLVLNPVEGLTTAEIRQGRGYLSIMDENARNLAQGLDCP
jgi:zinc transport system substrate-binding protein